MPKSSSATGATNYVVEGDILATRDDVCEWVFAVTEKRPPPSSGCTTLNDSADITPRNGAPELRFALCASGDPCVRPLSERNLTFVFDPQSFTANGITSTVYDKFKDEMIAAAKSWWGLDDVCPVQKCELRIEHDPSDDWDAARHAFVVRYVPNEQNWALGFFPTRNIDAKDRVLRIGWPLLSYWRRDPIKGLTQVQHTLRHEIGHILGYGHEESARDSKCVARDTYPVDPRRPRDAASIMNSSFCFDESMIAQTGALSGEDKRLHSCFYDAAQPGGCR